MGGLFDKDVRTISEHITMLALRKLFGLEVDSLGKNALTILSTCHIEREISNNRLQYLLNMHRSDITALLQELCKGDYLKSENKGRWTTYHLNHHYLSDSEISDAKVDSSKVDSSLAEKEAYNHPKRLAKKDLFEKICSLCKDEYKSIEEIAKEMNRKVYYLKNKVFPEMIEKGLNERLHPNITHPHQAYKATDQS